MLARGGRDGIAAAHLSGGEIRRAASVYRPIGRPVCNTKTAADRGRGVELLGAYGVEARARTRGISARMQIASLVAGPVGGSKRSCMQDLAGPK